MIEKVFIENYKSIHDAAISLRQLNVLIGSNGVGKSNFISFFEMMLKLFNKQLGVWILQQGGIDRILYQGLKHSDYVRGLVDFNNTNAFFFKLKSTVNNKAYIDHTGDFFNNRRESDKEYVKKWNQTLWDSAVEESGIIDSMRWRANYLKEFFKSFTIYHFHDTSGTAPMRRPCNVGDNEFLRHDASNLAAVLYRLQETDPQILKLIEGVVRSIAPYFERFDLHPDRIDNNKITLKWAEKNSDMYLDANSFSDGTIRFVALATVLLQPNAPETIIIDEPELGLHPSAINKLAALINKASKRTQIIVATQSVNLVNCFEPEDIIVIDRKDDQTVFNRLDSDDLSSWLEDYSVGEIWEKNIIGGQP